MGSAMGLLDSFRRGFGGSGRGLPVAPTPTSIACLSSFLHLSSVPLRARTRILYFRNAQLCWQGGGRGLAPEPSSLSSGRSDSKGLTEKECQAPPETSQPPDVTR